MPTYEYQCTECNYIFEEFQSITAEPLSECPMCGRAVRRLISAGVGIIFKGSGFYTTDYKKTSGSTTPSASSENTKESESKSEKKKDDTKKPDAKSGKKD